MLQNIVEAVKSLIRPVLAAVVVGVFSYGFLVKLVGVDVFGILVTTVIVFYFEERSKEKMVKAIEEIKGK